MREDSLMRLLRTSHPGPTMVVTLIAFLLACSLWPIGSSALIAFTIFTGQLCVGWTNDLVDMEIDRHQNRTDKPLAQGLISASTVSKAIYVALLFCIPLSIFGPLGLRGGLVHLLGVGCGISYNFFFKRTLLSPIPYAIAFAGLPTSIALSKGSLPPAWLIFAGGIFGISAHFTNVVKDLDRDRAAGIFGLPQILGARNSQIIAGSGLIVVALILQSATQLIFLLPLSILVFLSLFLVPRRYSFLLIMLLAVLDVIVLVSSAGDYRP